MNNNLDGTTLSTTTFEIKIGLPHEAAPRNATKEQSVSKMDHKSNLGKYLSP
jgi:hypothetical protein